MSFSLVNLVPIVTSVKALIFLKYLYCYLKRPLRSYLSTQHSALSTFLGVVMRWFCAVLTLFSQLSFATDSSNRLIQEQNHFYVVKERDSIIKILRSFGIRPAWGKSGAIVRILSDNSFLQTRNNNPDLVYPNERIQFDASFNDVLLNRKDLGFADINESGEINFICSKESLEKWAALRKELEPSLDPFDRRYPSLALDCKLQLRSEVNTLATCPVVLPKRQIAGEPVPTSPQTAQPETPVISPQAPEAKPKEKVIDSHMDFSLGSGYSQLNSSYNSSQSSANVLSQSMQEATFRWEQHWTELSHTFIQWNYMNMPFVSANQGTIYNGSQYASNFSVGGNYKLSSNWQSELAVGMRGYIFAPSYSSGTASLELKSLPYTQVQFVRDLAQVRSLSIKAGIGASYIAPSTVFNYNINSGYSYFGLLRVEQKLEHFRLFTEGQYESFNQSTSLTNETYQEIWTRLGISWDL
jgi:hypothetical protein